MSDTSETALPLLVTAAVIRRGRRVLITQRPHGRRDAGFWEFPGGKLHPGESPAEGLRREIREELGVEVTVGPLLETLHHCYEWGSVLLLFHECRLDSGTPKNLEVADHRWVRPQDLPRFPLLAADLPFARRLAGREGARLAAIL